MPRDREGSFEPVLIPKHDRRFTGFDDKIVAMYARGMTVREIQALAALILSGADRPVETWLVDQSPAWLTRWTTRF